MTIEENSRTQRFHDLDFVRATAMLLGLLLHVCIFFMPAHKYFWGAGEYFGDVLEIEVSNAKARSLPRSHAATSSCD